MIVLTIRTDSETAEVAVYNDANMLSTKSWQAHRELANTIHVAITEVLTEAKVALKNIDGVAVYHGPGSFTGLRIGVSVANALAYGLNIPVCSASNDDWQSSCITRLLHQESDYPVVPQYGALPHITTPKH